MQNNRLTVGVLGGMGPHATLDFLSRVLELTTTQVEQDHVPMLIDHNPQIPNRQIAIRTGDDEDVRTALVKMAVRLELAGADFLAMPCNTAHAFAEEIAALVSIPFVSIIDTTISEVVEHEVAKVGLLATNACLNSGMYQRAAKKSGLELYVLSAEAQARLMQLVFQVKQGRDDDEAYMTMTDLACRLIDAGAQGLIAGCTEIPLVLRADTLKIPVVSSTDALARRCVAISCGHAPLPIRRV